MVFVIFVLILISILKCVYTVSSKAIPLVSLGWSSSTRRCDSVSSPALTDAPVFSYSSHQPAPKSYCWRAVKDDEYFSSWLSMKHQQSFIASCLHLLQPLSLQAAFVFITRSGWLEAIKKQTQGEKYKVRVGMWRKTEVKCWHADVLADNT